MERYGHITLRGNRRRRRGRTARTRRRINILDRALGLGRYSTARYEEIPRNLQQAYPIFNRRTRLQNERRQRPLNRANVEAAFPGLIAAPTPTPARGPNFLNPNAGSYLQQRIRRMPVQNEGMSTPSVYNRPPVLSWTDRLRRERQTTQTIMNRYYPTSGNKF